MFYVLACSDWFVELQIMRSCIVAPIDDIFSIQEFKILNSDLADITCCIDLPIGSGVDEVPVYAPNDLIHVSPVS